MDTSLLFAIAPVLVSIVGVWIKLNNVTSQQEVKIANLEREIKESKERVERLEERIDKKLDSIETKLDTFMMHFSKCQNFKI